MRELTELELATISGGVVGHGRSNGPTRFVIDDPVVYEWPIIPAFDLAIESYTS